MLNISTARLRALPQHFARTAERARDRFTDLVSQARRALLGQHGHHEVAQEALQITVAPPVTAGPVAVSAGNSLDSSHGADDAGDSTIASESENRQYGSVHEFDESSYSIALGASEKVAFNSRVAPPPSQLLLAFAALHQKVQVLASALKGAGPQHMHSFKAELDLLEGQAEELMKTAQTRPQAEKQAAGDHFLIITDAINVAQLKLEML